MIELELDGKKVTGGAGSTILEVALKEGKYIPHFCYHKKLSIAANCRMCLVEVEKMPKPVPACATPVTEGMKIHTCSKLAVEAQKGVMEFLLINHPLDCPICDQGGECQLQDLALGYGRSSSRFNEDKRAVNNKDLGPLVSTEMTRCIHCSRCVRFTDEIAGYQELGISYRTNHAEVMPFIGKAVTSELSGNIIDLCPVGALISKPFRNLARSWELSRRKSIAPHDGLGSSIIVQVDKYYKVVRVLPLENETINECWLSDRDRFSYEGLYHEERATRPMIKQDGQWLTVDWETAIAYAAKSIQGVISDHGSEAIGTLASSSSTVEELYLLQKLMRNLGVSNLDHRLSQADFSLDNAQVGATSLGTSIADFAASSAFLVIGSLLRQEQPLLAQRVRQAVKKGAVLNVINVMAEDWLCEVQQQVTLDPRQLTYFLAQLVKATQTPDLPLAIDLAAVEVSAKAQAMAASLRQQNAYVVLGEIAKSLPNYAEIRLLTQQLISNIQGKLGILAGRANEVGAQLVGFLPFKAAFNQTVAQVGMNAHQMLASPRRGYVLLNTELERDAYDAQLAVRALNSADTVIVMSAFVTETMQQYADVILPITPFTETAGSFVNMEGVWQKFNGVTRPLAEAKPGWKVLRVLANTLGVADFDYTNIEEVRNELAQLTEPADLLNNKLTQILSFKVTQSELSGLVRCGITGIYDIDSITRRAPALQQTSWASLPILAIHSSLAARLDLSDQAIVTVKQAETSESFSVSINDKLPETMVFLAVTKATSSFAGRFAAIEISAC